MEKANADNEIVAVKYNRELGKNELIKWRCYMDTSFGRRYFIFKTDPHLNREDYCSAESSLTRFDEHGNKIIKVYRQPDFLKFAQNKISLSVGLVLKSGYRRKHCYRDVRPPISEFLSRTGGISFGNTLTPQMRLTLPPGAWRLLPEQHEGGTDDVQNSGLNDVAGSHTATTPHHPEIGSALSGTGPITTCAHYQVHHYPLQHHRITKSQILMRISAEFLMGRKWKGRISRWPCGLAGPVDTLLPYQAHLSHNSLDTKNNKRRSKPTRNT